MSNEITEAAINGLFDQLDHWRHLPSYQLERRVDIFLSQYLVEVLQNKLGEDLKSEICPDVIPEFPLNLNALGYHGKGEQSCKVDYLALSGDKKTAILVELKTDVDSRNDEQDEYLHAAREKSFAKLLEGINSSFFRSRVKRKYFQLFLALEKLGLVSVPDGLKNIMRKDFLRGATDKQNQISIEQAGSVENILVVFIQPEVKDSGKFKPDKVILFDDFIVVLEKKSDLISKRFAESLTRWRDEKAGHPAK